MARREPAAVRSRIQSPSLMSQVTMQPAIGTPCKIDELIANVSRTSMLSRRSLSHTFHARWAIGSAFQSIRGRLTAVISGLALNAISSDTVGSASGKRFETAGRVESALAARFELDAISLMSFRLAC